MQYKGELTVVLKYIPAEKNLTLPLDQVQGTFQAFLPVSSTIGCMIILLPYMWFWLIDLIHCFISQSSFV